MRINFINYYYYFLCSCSCYIVSSFFCFSSPFHSCFLYLLNCLIDFILYFPGEFPLEVHILVDRFMIEDVPTEKPALEQVRTVHLISIPITACLQFLVIRLFVITS
jgi:hypothetical protein